MSYLLSRSTKLDLGTEAALPVLLNGVMVRFCRTQWFWVVIDLIPPLIQDENMGDTSVFDHA